jgi:hypothetical protein
MKYLLIFLLGCSNPEVICYQKSTFWGLDKYSGHDGFPQYDIKETVCNPSNTLDTISWEDFVIFQYDTATNRLKLGNTVKRKLITTYTRL